jgi:hypothetical protein
MPSPLLADAFGHHVWATIRVLDCMCRPRRRAAGNHRARDVRLHPRHAPSPRGWDVFYLNVLLGGELEPFDKNRSDVPTLRAVMDAHDAVWQRLVAGDLDPDTVVVEYEESGYETHAPLAIRLAQALHHGTDHRSQVCTALTNLGTEPPAIEAWDFAARDGRMFTIESSGSAARGRGSSREPVA